MSQHSSLHRRLLRAGQYGVLCALLQTLMFTPSWALSKLSSVNTTPHHSSIIDLNPSRHDYLIDNTVIRLVDGEYHAPVAPGAHSLHTTKLIQQVSGELNDQTVTVALLRDQPGGSGTFFYLAVLTGSNDPTPTVLLGDRIQVQALTIKHNRLSMSYLDRPQNTPFATEPSIAKTQQFRLQHGKLVKIE